jgi:pyruvyl transferase EpsO
MINELKKFCRSNKLIFYISRVVYYPLKVVMLYKPKKLYRDEAIKALKGRDMGKPAIFFFGIPVHKNLGDLAQTYCSFRYFEKYWPDYQLLAMRTYSTYSKKYIKMLQDNIREDDVIFFQSGYCTTDEHLDHTMHKIMVKAFPNNKIVFMPQTVLFNNNKEKTKTSELFDAHKRTLFIARDEMSYNTAK